MSQGLYENLQHQMDKLFNHVNQGSIKTRYRYREAVNRFCQFVADEFRLQKFENVQEKHIVAYVKHMQEKGLSASTIKTELSGIRFFHDQVKSRYRLPDNQKLGELGATLERRKFRAVPRAWGDNEFTGAFLLAEAQGKPEMARMLEYARFIGLRIHETTKLNESMLKQALESNYLTIKGKGGLIREVPLTYKSRDLIQRTLQMSSKQTRLFVGPNEKAHQVIKRVENWIYIYRDQFTKGDVKLTYHGLRHAYAQERYAYHLQRETGDDKAARLAVSRELGHGRDEVTRIYLNSGNK